MDRPLTAYAAVFFDFDGLLVNTEQLHFQAYKQLIEDRGLSFTIEYTAFAAMAHTSSSALRSFLLSTYPSLNAVPWEVLYAEKTALFLDILANGPLEFMPGADAIITLLHERKMPMCVVTNSAAPLTDPVRQRLPKLNLIPYWVTRECYTHPKPHPDAYKAALTMLKVSPEEVVGFEDSLRGAESMQAAGVTPILICDPHHPQMGSPLATSLESYETLIAFLEAVSESVS